MELKTKIYLVDENDEKFMGIGVVWLLEKILEKGSLRAAAANLGISYSKAYSMIAKLEKSLGKAVIVRRKGGTSRVGATLTLFGITLLNSYKTFHDSMKEITNAPYEVFAADFNKILSKYNDDGDIK